MASNEEPTLNKRLLGTSSSMLRMLPIPTAQLPKRSWKTEDAEVTELKKKLKDLLHGLATPTMKSIEIDELTKQLEKSKKPMPLPPIQALQQLLGTWILVYTSSPKFLPVFKYDLMPVLKKVDEISQTIDPVEFAVQNCLKFAGPLATSVTTNGKYEIQSPKIVQIMFKKGAIGTPKLTDSIVIPDNLELFGQNIDLSSFKGVFSSIQNDAAPSVAHTVSEQPSLKIPITTDKAQSWLFTAYLDGDLRISRDDSGDVFVLLKKDSPLLR